MSQGFLNNDTNPEKNAFKWLYYSVKDLSKILLPRFWKLIVLLTCLHLFRDFSDFIFSKYFPLLAKPEILHHPVTQHQAPVSRIYASVFDFQIFAQILLGRSNILLIVLAIIAAAFFCTKRETPHNTTMNRRFLLFLFIVFICSFFISVYGPLKVESPQFNYRELRIFITLLMFSNMFLFLVDLLMSITVIYMVLYSQPIRLIYLIDNMRKYLASFVWVSAIDAILLTLIVEFVYDSYSFLHFYSSHIDLYYVASELLLTLSNFFVVIIGMYIIIHGNKFRRGFLNSLISFPVVSIHLLLIFLTKQGLYWGTRYVFDFTNNIHALKPLYLHYWAYPIIKYSVIMFIDLLLIKLFMDFSERVEVHECEYQKSAELL